MNKLLLIILMFPVIAFAQLEAGNFKVTEEGRVIWQKVYEDSTVKYEDVLNTIRSNRKFSDINTSETKITFLATGLETNPSAVGYSRGGTSFYALGDINAFFTIDFKDGRYRITGSNISSNVPMINILAAGLSDHKQTPIEESVGNGKGLKKGFIKKESVIMNHAIESQFKIVKNKTDDNW